MTTPTGAAILAHLAPQFERPLMTVEVQTPEEYLGEIISDLTTKSGRISGIEDEGEGIPEKHLARIFDPFFTTKEESRGIGLGLAVSYGIVQAHGGDIEVESRVGAGTKFTVRLPLRPPAAASSKDEEE